MNDIKLAEWYLFKSEDAKKRGLDFDISILSLRNIFKAKYCYFTGSELADEPGKWNSKTIDRLDPNKGYIKGNVVASSYAANQFKSHIERENGLSLSDMNKIFNKYKKLQVKPKQILSKPMKFEGDLKIIKFTGPTEDDLVGRIKGKYTVKGYLGAGVWLVQCTCGEEFPMKTAVIKKNTIYPCSKCGLS